MGDDWHEFFGEEEFLYDWAEARELEALAQRYLAAVLSGQDDVVLELGILSLDDLADVRSRLLDALDGPFASQEPLATHTAAMTVELRLKTKWGDSADIQVVFARGSGKVESLTLAA